MATQIQKGWKVDTNQCISCRACEMACKVEYGLHAGQGRRRRVIENTVLSGTTAQTVFLSLACNHCNDPACIAACPKSKSGNFDNDALYKDDGTLTSAATEGVVMVNSDNCVGCRRCEWACPYGAPQYNPTTKKIHKCEMCWQRVKNTDLHSSRQVPACEATCIGGAIKLMDVDNDPAANSNADFLKENPTSGTDYRSGGPLDLEPFVSPGQTGLGSEYVADASLTNPSLKIRNRRYLDRDGSLI